VNHPVRKNKEEDQKEKGFVFQQFLGRMNGKDAQQIIHRGDLSMRCA
jgi:hypothetical protein